MSNEKSSAKDEVRFNVRISPDLHSAVVTRAKLNERSMNAEVISMLEDALLAPNKRGIGELLADLERYNREIAHLVQMVSAARRRRSALMADIERVSGGAISVHPIEPPESEGADD